ncbi:MAG: beta strand repeat-containing protein [Thermomicrobiales bacterium]
MSAQDVIAGNWIGVAPGGTAAGNYYGIGMISGGATQNTIGGTASADRNLISGNNTGVSPQGGAISNVIEGNLLGTNAAGAGGLGNSFGGVLISGSAANNTIGGTSAGQANVIASNGGYGVFIGSGAADTGSVGNTIRSNSIHDNGVSGIALNGVGANDSCDVDSGPNSFQNSPILSAATATGGTTAISGKLDSTTSRTFHIDIYASPTNAGQGQTYLGSQDVTTNGACAASFSSVSFPVVTGQPWITATATDTTTGDSSQFSTPLDTAAAIVATAGTPQSTSVNSAFGTALQATVTDSTGAGVTGVSVTFTPNVGTNGASGAFAGSTTVTTDASGVATAPTLTANGSVGAFTVTAATSGVSGTTTFNLTNTPVACQVNSTMDPTEANKLTLRGAVALLNNGDCTGDTITFDPAVFPVGGAQKITLNNEVGTLRLTFTTRPVTITGTNAGVVVDGNNAVTVFLVNAGATATLDALTVQHGHTATNTGGGIINGGTLTVTNSTLSSNSGTSGGGINTVGAALTVTNSTISGNSATNNGGGIFTGPAAITVTNSTISGNTATNGGGIFNSNVLTVTNSTLSGNSATNTGGGIYNAGPATLTNTIVANSPSGGDLVTLVGGSFTGTHNLIDDAATAGGFTDTSNGNIVGHPALLGTLGSYGGLTPTVPLLPGSPAIDAGTSGGSVPTADQRGKPRINASDIGAFESQGFTLAKTSGDGQAAPVGTQFGLQLVVTVTAKGSGEPVAGGVVTFAGPASGAGIQPSPLAATISGGAASATVTANLVAGTNYPVQASATGATAVSFTLSNTNPLTSIAVTCAGSTTPSIKVGQPLVCVATGTYQDGSMAPLPAVQVTWSGDNNPVATVDGQGNVTGLSAGTVHITATDGNVTKTITVTVAPPILTGVTPAPAPQSRPAGASAPGTPAPVPAPAPGGPPASGGSGAAPAPLPTGR